ncbi:MAG TPA: EamA family transporter [Mesorhizobium sp.]|jgi:O-acetylserine/cysteine efflux transporter|nr:EamA family transporter [Mesorhizobium sp.]
MTAAPLAPRHLLLALAVVAIWGTNFVVIRVGLDRLPPFLFATLRFVFACFPALFFLRRPQVTWASLAAYGVLIGAVQFGLLYLAMQSEISPGLASLVVQVQVFFTIGLSVWISGERVRLFQLAALALAALGILIIALNTDGRTTPLGLGLVLTAAAGWAGGNIVAKQSKVTDLLPFVVWGSLFSVPPLAAMSLLFEGAPAIRAALAQADALTWAAVFWQSAGNTLFGYAAWGWLLSRYPAATVSPLALLIPVVGIGSSALFLGEPLPAWKLAAAGLVMAGLALGVLYPRWAARANLSPAA